MRQKAVFRKPLLALFLFALAISFFELIFYRITFGVLDDAPDALKLADGFLHRAAEVLCIGGMCGVYLARFCRGGIRAAAKSLWLPTARLLYFLPYYYAEQFAVGYDSSDSLILGALLSVLRVILLGIILPALLAVIGVLAEKLFFKKPLKTEDCGMVGYLQFEAPLPFAALFASLPIFIYSFILEIIAAVGYLTDYAGSYQIGEIVYMGISFLFDLGLLFLHAFGVLFACRILSAKAEPIPEKTNES